MWAQFIINFFYLAEWIVYLSVMGIRFCWRERIYMRVEVIFQACNLLMFIQFLAGTTDSNNWG